jgi:histidinol phosphatase-like PHP family hydrolase
MPKQPANSGQKNVKPIRDTETAKARGKLGGIKSGESKRERKFISAIYADVLAKKLAVTIGEDAQTMTGIELVEHAVKTALAAGGSPAVSMMKEIREATEGTKAMMTVDNVIEIKHTFDPKGI